MADGTSPTRESSPGPGLRTTLTKFLTPTRAPADESERIMLRGLMLLTLFLLPSVVIQMGVMRLDSATGYGLLPTFAGLIATYAVLHAGRLKAGGLLLAAVLWLTDIFMHLALPRTTVVNYIVMLEFPFLALLVAQALLPLRWFLALLLVTIVHLLSVPIPTGGGLSPLISVIVACIIFNTMGTFAILNGAIQRARALVEDDLRESQARYRIISELVSDFVYKLRTTPEGDIIEVEWAGEAKDAPGEASAKPPPNWQIHPDDLADMVKSFARQPETGRKTAEIRVRDAQGEYRWLRVYMQYETDPVTGKPAAVYGAAQDIHKRKQAEDALRQSESRLRAISDHNVMAIVLLRLEDGRILYANATSHTILGYAPGELLQPDALRAIMSRETRLHLRDMLETQDQIEQMEVEATRRDGTPVWLNLSLSRRVLDDEVILVATAFDISARKAAEIALKESERRYGELLNSIDGVVWVCRADNFQTLFITRQVEQVTGYRMERFYQDATLWRALVHPDDRDSMVSIAQEAIARDASFQREYRLVSADGRIIWLRDVVSLDTVNDVKIMRGVSINITESKEAQQAEEAQRRLNDALRDTAVTINQTLDLNEVMRRILDQTYRVIPCEAADIILLEGDEGHVLEARGYTEFNHDEDLRRFSFNIRYMPTFQTMIRTGKSLRIDDTQTHPMWRYNEATAWIGSTLGAPIQINGETIGFLNVTSRRTHAFSDVQAATLETFANQVALAIRNARLYAQVLQDAEALESQVQERTAELNLERQRIAAMLDFTGEGIFYTEGVDIRYVNQAMCTLTGYSAEELIGAPAAIFTSGDETETRAILENIVTEIMAQGVWRGELRLQRKDGSRFFAGLTVARVGSDTEMVRAVSVLRDISKNRALQQQQSNLVAFASHELRTPITNLKTRLYLLRRRPEQLETHLEILEAVTERMRRLVEDLLNISRLERGVIPLHPATLDIDHELRSVIDIQRPEAERKGLTLEYEAPPEPTFVEADSERLAQVITNLVTNAINYTLAGGSVRVQVACPPGDDMVSVHIIDTGVGIAPEHLPHIFQPFYRVVSHVDGTGLGLSIARQIVSMHGGELTVASTPGAGSTFTLRLRRVNAGHSLDAGSERRYLHDTPDDVMLRDEDPENISGS